MAPKQARTTSRGRIYTRRGRNYWSVTTIIKGGLPAPALQHWGMRAVAEYAVANHRQIAAMLGAVTLRKAEGRAEPALIERLRGLFGAGETEPVYVISDPDAIASTVDWLKNAPYRESRRKMDIGTAVHAIVEATILERPIPAPDPELAPFVAQFEAWRTAFSPTFEMSEASVFSDAESYAGTLDIIAVVGGRRLLIDTKTGKGVYPEAALQLAAYAHADFVGLADGTDEPMPKVEGGAVLHLRPDGYAFVPVRIDDDVFRAFLFAREVFRWCEETSRGVIGEPASGPDAVAFMYPATLGDLPAPTNEGEAA